MKKVKNNYYKLVRLFFTLFLSTYLSLLITNKIFVGYENITAYSITNSKYLVTFFTILLIHNLLSLFTYNFTLYLNYRQLKYLAISTSIIELIILMFIKIEFILIVIIKSILFLIKPNKITTITKNNSNNYLDNQFYINNINTKIYINHKYTYVELSNLNLSFFYHIY